MPENKDIQKFLGRLESSANNKWEALNSRQELHIANYMQSRTCPGPQYLYVGSSENLDSTPTGIEKRLQRNICLNLLFEAKGNEHHCVRLDLAMNFAGFAEGLSRFEKDFLKRMPAETMLGPSCDENGSRISGAFTIWKELSNEKKSMQVLAAAK
jgi:hypothetical protein